MLVHVFQTKCSILLQQWYNAGAGFDPAAKPVTTWQIIRSNYPREPYYDQGQGTCVYIVPCDGIDFWSLCADAKDLYRVHPEYFETAKPLRGMSVKQEIPDRNLHQLQTIDTSNENGIEFIRCWRP